MHSSNCTAFLMQPWVMSWYTKAMEFPTILDCVNSVEQIVQSISSTFAWKLLMSTCILPLQLAPLYKWPVNGLADKLCICVFCAVHDVAKPLGMGLLEKHSATFWIAWKPAFAFSILTRVVFPVKGWLLLLSVFRKHLSTLLDKITRLLF